MMISETSSLRSIADIRSAQCRSRLSARNSTAKDRRLTLRLTQQEFADLIGYSVSMVKKYEAGKCEASNAVLKAIREKAI